MAEDIRRIMETRHIRDGILAATAYATTYGRCSKCGFEGEVGDHPCGGA